jgi:hypothetical protein
VAGFAGIRSLSGRPAEFSPRAKVACPAPARGEGRLRRCSILSLATGMGLGLAPRMGPPGLMLSIALPTRGPKARRAAGVERGASARVCPVPLSLKSRRDAGLPEGCRRTDPRCSWGWSSPLRHISRRSLPCFGRGEGRGLRFDGRDSASLRFRWRKRSALPQVPVTRKISRFPGNPPRRSSGRTDSRCIFPYPVPARPVFPSHALKHCFFPKNNV